MLWLVSGGGSCRDIAGSQHSPQVKRPFISARRRKGPWTLRKVIFDQPTFLAKYGYEPSFLLQPFEILEPPSCHFTCVTDER